MIVSRLKGFHANNVWSQNFKSSYIPIRKLSCVGQNTSNQNDFVHPKTRSRTKLVSHCSNNKPNVKYLIISRNFLLDLSILLYPAWAKCFLNLTSNEHLFCPIYLLLQWVHLISQIPDFCNTGILSLGLSKIV